MVQLPDGVLHRLTPAEREQLRDWKPGTIGESLFNFGDCVSHGNRGTIAMKHTKYLRIYDWNYWWGVYRCGGGWKPPDGAEFSITEDEAGENRFFHFDFYNLAALEETLRERDFLEPDSPDCPAFLENAQRLQRGEQEFFLGALYYPNYTPDLESCSRDRAPLLRRLSPPVPPYYGVVFLREERPLEPEVLRQWVEKLSRPLFGEAFSCVLAHVPTRQETLEQFREEMRCLYETEC